MTFLAKETDKMKRALATLFSAVVFVSLAASTRAEEIGKWPAKKTYVMMVGVLDYEYLSDMGTEDRRDQTLCDTFVECGVPKEQVTFIKGKDAILANVKKAFSALLKKTKKGDFLIIFFDGHGVAPRGKGRFALYNARGRTGYWDVTDVFKDVEKQFKGDHILMMADCCHAGAMGDEMMELKTDKAYACLSSAPVTTTSADSWAFTEALIDGFKGAAYVDSDRDGEISLSELKDHAFAEMREFCDQEADFAMNKKFPEKFTLVNAKERTNEDIGRLFEMRTGKTRRWRKARAMEIDNGLIKLRYYPDGFVGYVTNKVDSENVRTVVRK
jgi:hypothetical protein